jgi:hypothetical protein
MSTVAPPPWVSITRVVPCERWGVRLEGLDASVSPPRAVELHPSHGRRRRALLERVRDLPPHPDLVPVLDVAPIDDETAWVVRPAPEGARGRPLLEALRAGELDREGALEVLAMAARAVGHAHRHGLGDGQLEPDAVLVPRGAPPRVLLGAGSDWTFIEDGTMLLIRDGQLVHVPPTISPARVVGAGDPIPDDVWALGVLLFQTLTGRAPFRGCLQDMFRAIVDEPPPAPSSLARDVHPELDLVVLRALQDRRRGELLTADELADALVDALVRGRALRREP